MRIKELSLNPADSFSAGFKKADKAIDKAFTPSQWGKGGGSSEPSSVPSKSNKPSLTLEKYQIRDAEGIMQAVVKGNLSVLTPQQTELARDMLNQIQKL
jgi:hypothetical protein